jgi:serine/threonine-protein kinase
MGVREPELDYALGRVLGELYSRALEDARRSGDQSYFAKRKEEIDREYLAPALVHLERCRGQRTVSASYLDGLVDFYNHRYDEALREAELARKSVPWLYEAAKLEGDVFMARALEAKDHGDNDEAGRRFQDAVQRYGEAADIGRSDHQVYEALAEAWIRQEEMDMYAGRDPAPKLEKALAAADKALVAAPAESYGHTKKAFAYNFQALYAMNHGAPRDVIEQLYRAEIAAGEQAIALHPGDAYAREITGSAYSFLSSYLVELGQPVEGLLDKAFPHLEQAIRLNPRFPWAYNDYGYALTIFGYSKKLRNEHPEEWFEKAIDAQKKATQIDDQYVIAYNNTSLVMNELALWKADHGEDPEKVALESAQAADRALEINRRQPFAHGNAGAAFAIVASYRLDAGQDGREPARRAIDHFKEFLAIDPNHVFPLRELARAHRLLAAHERAQGLDPRPSLDAGLAALGQCYRVAPGDADCKAAEAQIRGEQASFAQQRAEPSLEALEQAQKLAAEAVQKVASRADLWLVLGQVCLQRAEALAASPRPPAPPGPVIEEGLRGIERALEKAPGFPRALAVRGALLVRKAANETDPGQKKAALDRARESLSQAFAGNPLLERRYGGAAEEAKRLAGGK